MKVGGILYFDVMGKFGIYEGIYIGMIDYNVIMIVMVLGGKVDSCGMCGELSGVE